VSKVGEVLVELAARLILPIADAIVRRQEKSQPERRARLDPAIRRLSIEDAVEAARADMEQRRKAERDGKR
jgi:hypothetical protein